MFQLTGIELLVLLLLLLIVAGCVAVVLVAVRWLRRIGLQVEQDAQDRRDRAAATAERDARAAEDEARFTAARTEAATADAEAARARSAAAQATTEAAAAATEASREQSAASRAAADAARAHGEAVRVWTETAEVLATAGTAWAEAGRAQRDAATAQSDAAASGPGGRFEHTAEAVAADPEQRRDPAAAKQDAPDVPDLPGMLDGLRGLGGLPIDPSILDMLPDDVRTMVRDFQRSGGANGLDTDAMLGWLRERFGGSWPQGRPDGDGSTRPSGFRPNPRDGEDAAAPDKTGRDADASPSSHGDGRPPAGLWGDEAPGAAGSGMSHDGTVHDGAGSDGVGHDDEVRDGPAPSGAQDGAAGDEQVSDASSSRRWSSGIDVNALIEEALRKRGRSDRRGDDEPPADSPEDPSQHDD